jgi:hypothetical protein
MDHLLDDLTRAARRCERAARTFNEGRFSELKDRILAEVKAVHRAWSGSWIGYHSRVYIQGLQPARAGEHFDSEWGAEGGFSNATRGRWAIVDSESVKEEILHRAGVTEEDRKFMEETVTRGVAHFDEVRNEILPTLDAMLNGKADATLRRVRDEIDSLEASISEHKIVQVSMPNQVMSRDSTAIAEGLKAPAHLELQAKLLSQASPGASLVDLAKHARYLVTYLEKGMKMSGKSIARTEGKIFIGHGRSAVWRDLKDFIQDRLRLTPDEFNREPTAGLSNKERLEAMLDDATFAFLVMTAEDELADGKVVARANVIHEVGLFQGRLGFERAIILLEEGCEEFSNIVGLTQIRFPKGNIKAQFEEVRRVLERERILKM